MKVKQLPLGEAIRDLVRDGDSVVLGACLEPMIPFAATREIMRQKKRDLNLIAPISDASSDMLIGAGCVAEVTGAWVGNVTGGLAHNYRRAVESGIPRRIKVNDYSNFSLAMALLAGAYGMPYAPLRSLLGSDILKSNPDLRVVENPLGKEPEPIVLVPPLRPDVAILPVQRADRFGNSHFWGSTGVSQEAAMASKRVILLAEEIVPAEVIASDPNRVLYPGFAVSAVVECAAGVHPSPMTGVWQRDTEFFNEYHRRSRERDGFLDWLQEWVLGPADHAAYLAKLGARLDGLRIKSSRLAAPANFAAE